jgi:hypothetical protein
MPTADRVANGTSTARCRAGTVLSRPLASPRHPATQLEYRQPSTKYAFHNDTTGYTLGPSSDDCPMDNATWPPHVAVHQLVETIHPTTTALAYPIVALKITLPDDS